MRLVTRMHLSTDGFELQCKPKLRMLPETFCRGTWSITAGPNHGPSIAQAAKSLPADLVSEAGNYDSIDFGLPVHVEHLVTLVDLV